jgi:hypothetical protein
MSTTQTAVRPRVDLATIALVVLTIAVAAIHFSRAVANSHITVLFTLNGLGYLGLVSLYFLPAARRMHALVRGVFISYTALTFVLFFVWGIMKGEWPWIGFVCVALEAIMIALLWFDPTQTKA